MPFPFLFTKIQALILILPLYYAAYYDIFLFPYKMRSRLIMLRYAIFIIILSAAAWNSEIIFPRIQSGILQEFVNLICLPDYLVDMFRFFCQPV